MYLSSNYFGSEGEATLTIPGKHEYVMRPYRIELERTDVFSPGHCEYREPHKPQKIVSQDYRTPYGKTA